MMSDEGDALSLDQKAMKALTAESRVKILKKIDERKRRTVSQLSRDIGLDKSTVHEHLKQLLDAGFINRLDGNGNEWIYYELTRKGKNVLYPKNKFIVILSSAIVSLTLAMIQLIRYIIEVISARPPSKTMGDLFLLYSGIALLIASIILLIIAWSSWKKRKEKI
jgi:DNA-binding MarR family transcriptional regulator